MGRDHPPGRSGSRGHRTGPAIDAGTPYQSEYRTLAQSGEVRWLASRGQIVNDAGPPSRLIGTLSDITTRKQLEEKLRYATESLNIAQAADGLATFDFNFGRNSCICSDTFHALLGIPPSTPLDDLGLLLSRVHREDVARSRDATLATTPEDPSYRCEYRVMLDGGGERWIGEKATVSRQIRRDRAHHRRHRRHQRFEARRSGPGFHRSPPRAGDRGTQDELWELDLATNTPWFGLRFEEILGYSVGDLNGSRARVQTLIHPLDRDDVSSGDQCLAEIVSALRSSDLATIGTRAHALKGASANIYALGLAAAASSLESAARANSVGEIDSLVQALAAKLRAVNAGLRKAG
jgi:PAS domain-containing protein